MPDLLDRALHHRRRGDQLLRRGDLDAARTEYLASLALHADDAEALDGLGGVELTCGHLVEAVAHLDRSLRIRPDSAQTLTNMGSTLLGLRRVFEAIEYFRRAIRVAPDFAEAHLNLGYAQLLLGQFAEGWAGYEWRLRRLGQRRAERRWEGAPLDGASIVLWGEQGFGDTVQFCRYAPMVADRGGRVTLHVAPALVPLLQGLRGVQAVIATDRPAPPAEWHCPLPSLPFVFGTDATSVPSPVPYLSIDPRRAARFRARIDRDAVNIGLVWAGNPRHPRDRHRSMPLQTYAPLFEIERVHFYSLQCGPADDERRTTPCGRQLRDVDRDNDDFQDTAALIEALDLVITVDTAVAHVAGALGRPVWILIAYSPDWRWMLETARTPWYPTARLFRQPAPGAWTELVRALTGTLRERVATAHIATRSGPV